MTDNACLLKVRKSLSRWRTGASLTRVAGWRGEGGTGNMVTTPTLTNWQLPLWRSRCCLCPVISPVAASVDSFLTAHYISCQWRRAVVMNESENGISKCWFDHIKQHRGGGEWCSEVTLKWKPTNVRINKPFQSQGRLRDPHHLRPGNTLLHLGRGPALCLLSKEVAHEVNFITFSKATYVVG